jgi:hypothetical protein
MAHLFARPVISAYQNQIEQQGGKCRSDQCKHNVDIASHGIPSSSNDVPDGAINQDLLSIDPKNRVEQGFPANGNGGLLRSNWIIDIA